MEGREGGQGGGRRGGGGGKGGCGRGGGWDGGNPRNLSGSSVGRQSRLLGGGPIMAINFFHLPLQSTIIIILPILNIGIHAIIIIIWYLCSAAKSGKICLHWTEFKENVDTAFGNFREDNALSDLTLACEDGFQIEAHKVILAASSSFFQSLLLGIKNPHPKWCLRGLQSKDLVATVEFLYSGESNILGENLKYFLAIAKEFQKKVLFDQNSEDLMNTQEKVVKLIPKKEETKSHHWWLWMRKWNRWWHIWTTFALIRWVAQHTGTSTITNLSFALRLVNEQCSYSTFALIRWLVL